MTPARTRRLPAPRRAGFTMVELLIVITIIAVLMSLTIAVYRDSLENARIQATKATIRQLDAALQDRLEAFERVNLRSQAQQFKSAFDAAYPPSPGDPGLPPKVAEIIIRKDRFRAAFPQRVEDLWGVSQDPTVPDNAPLWRVWMRETGVTAAPWRPSVITPDIESSVLLHLALTQGSAFGLPSLNLDSINQNHIRTIETYTDSSGVTHHVSYFVDEWDRPLRFYNWPTRLTRPRGPGNEIDRTEFLASAGVLMRRAPTLLATQPALSFDVYSNPLNQDSGDQFGALTAELGSNPRGPILIDSGGTGYFNLTYPVGTIQAKPVREDYYHTFDTYHTPLIVSGGGDQRVGLFEPNGADPRVATPTPSPTSPARLALPLAFDPTSPDTSLLDQLTDNITNRQ